MSSPTKERNTRRMAEPAVPSVGGPYPVKGGEIIWKGSLVVLDSATGFAAMGSTATGLICLGRARADVDNSAGADGDLSVETDQGVFNWAGSGFDGTSIGAKAYVVDGQTVTLTGTGASLAGYVYKVDSLGVWVLTFIGLS